MGKRDHTKHYPPKVTAGAIDPRSGSLVPVERGRLIRTPNIPVPEPAFYIDRGITPRPVLRARDETSGPHVFTAEQIQAEWERQHQVR